MNDILDLYCKRILDNIEKELIKQRILVIRKGIFARERDKEYLKKLEQLWYDKLIYFEKLIEEEMLFYHL